LAIKKQTRFFTDRADLDKLDWSVISNRFWHNTIEDRDRQRRKQAELLVKGHVPPQCIDGIVTFGPAAQAKVQQIVLTLNLDIPTVNKDDGSFYY
jgi:hypothetical protein